MWLYFLGITVHFQLDRMIVNSRFKQVSINLKSALSFLIFTILCVSISACVVPPSGSEPSVLSRSELDYLAHLMDGRQYVSKRKLDAAENEFREAILLKSDVATAYNDLGYVLQEQNRLYEARQSYIKAVELDKFGLAPRENLARIYFKAGDYERAKGMYRELLDVNFMVASLTPDRENLSEAGLRQVYRNISLMLYVLGEEDEAICYSALASADFGDVNQAGEHARFLMSIGRFNDAFSFQSQMVDKFGLETLQPQVIMDYAINALFLGENNLASDLSWVLIRGRSGGRSVLSVSIAIFRLAGAWQDQEHQDRLAQVGQALEEDPEICNAGITLADYFPFNWDNKLQNALREVCASGN